MIELPDGPPPFPASIEPGLQPHGIVARTYSVEGEMVVEHRLGLENLHDHGALALEAAGMGVEELQRKAWLSSRATTAIQAS